MTRSSIVMPSSLCYLAVLVLCCSISSVNAEPKYLGCYRDNFNVGKRDLPSMLALEEKLMTPSLCEEICGVNHQYKYFGLQYGSECWCGNEYGKYGEVKSDSGDRDPKTSCTKPCSGDESLMCGGENMNSVYEVQAEYVPTPVHSDGRPLLGLVMIVKDEAHTLPATLLAIKPWIDVYYILDTGSTDGTQEAIRNTLGKDKGHIQEEPFIDYGRSRNRALEIAEKSTMLGGPPIFSLMLSADETIHNGLSLRKFCEEHRDKSGSMEEAYYMQMDVGWRFDSARLSRTDKSWRYQGRVHEYLASPTGHGAPTHRVPDTYIKFRVTDEERRSAREYTILKILLEETQEKPHDTRASFYLARTYNVIKNHTAALSEFRRRVSLGGWKEEVYESLYAIGWQLEALGAPWHEIQQAFLDCHAHSSERAEPLHAIASHWLREKNYALAWLFAVHASTLPYPTHASLWVQADVYSWQCWHVMGMSGLDIFPRKEREGAAAMLRALKKHPNDQAFLNQIERYRQALGQDVLDQIDCEIDPAHCKIPQQQQPADVNAHAAATDPHLTLAGGVANPNQHPPKVLNDANHLASSTTAPFAHQSTTPWLSALLVFLVVTNVVLLVALRKSKAVSACLPGGGVGMNKEV